jgi:hypothetical protein
MRKQDSVRQWRSVDLHIITNVSATACFLNIHGSLSFLDYSEDGGSKQLLNIGYHVPIYTALYHIHGSSMPTRKPQISHGLKFVREECTAEKCWRMGIRLPECPK